MSNFWNSIRKEIRGHMLTEPIEEFLTWPEIVSTMVVGKVAYIELEYDYLMSLDTKRWGPVILGEYRNRSNTNLIHQAYHLAQWELTTGLHIQDLKKIVEIGGGYGAMCLIARRAGFMGNYVIYDVPELNVLQTLYLSEMNVTAELKTEFHGDAADLLIGLFSLSEMDEKTQHEYLSQIQTDHILLAGLNAAWEGWEPIKALRSSFPGAKELEIRHIGGRLYLIK